MLWKIELELKYNRKMQTNKITDKLYFYLPNLVFFEATSLFLSSATLYYSCPTYINSKDAFCILIVVQVELLPFLNQRRFASYGGSN